ncbi:MAG: M1 family metallopeptidase [Saprospirales bacterium]|nr:M1 family metallopeptidase [Saprospirales bacterium]MBK8920857.1 M1 family metallopeptidase [Saprospirales bacterium]
MLLPLRFRAALFLCCFGSAALAQDLYMPLNLQKAYTNQTRSSDGLPGPKYWQNRAEYRIDVSVDLPTRQVSGTAGIRYFNQSPDSLTMIRIKLAHDLWRKNAERAYELALEDITDGVRLQNVRIGNTPVPADKMRQSNTFLDIRLDRALPPGAALELRLSWSYIAPAAPSAPRECVCDSTSWFAAYWYPQVAVYDDLHGWANAPYNGMQEMYNDFSDYEVRIDVPGNIMVWATGVWQNAADLLEPEFLRRYQQALESESIVQIFSPADYAAGTRFFRSADRHTLVYKADAVPDFAFGFSDHYLWDATSVLVDPAAGRRALVSAAYNPKSPDYYEVCGAAAKALHLMSTWLPGYPYPYPRMTVFNGDDGMEFPMMCNNASTHPRSPVGLTVHESSHTYFPFMMGINEQYYAWMDEGWASFFDVLVTDSITGKSAARLRNYSDFAGTDMDMPPMTPSRQLESAYRVAAYNRPQAAYMTLYQLLGYDRFHHCMKTYMDSWKGKHPQPFDFFYSWNAAAGENLDWFWKPWFFDWGYPDLAVKSAGPAGIVVENTGTMPVSVAGEIEYTDGSRERFWRPADVWKFGAPAVIIPVAAGKTLQKVTLGNPLVPDTVKENNTWVRA